MATKKENLSVRVFFPAMMQKEGFKGKAKAVSSENRLGKFDVLPQHINFISLIFNQLIIHSLEKEKIDYHFDKGVMVVKKNQVTVFLGL